MSVQSIDNIREAMDTNQEKSSGIETHINNIKSGLVLHIECHYRHVDMMSSSWKDCGGGGYADFSIFDLTKEQIVQLGKDIIARAEAI